MTVAPRHAQLVQFFQGRYGEGLYSQAVLLGPTGGAPVQMLSYMALYADQDFPYVTLVPGGMTPTSRQAASQARSLRFPGERARAESRGARAVIAGAPADVDEAIWSLGVQQVDPLGLPVIFMSWMRIIQSNQPKIMLWYPSMTQGRWALTRFQTALQHRS